MPLCRRGEEAPQGREVRAVLPGSSSHEGNGLQCPWVGDQEEQGMAQALSAQGSEPMEQPWWLQ